MQASSRDTWQLARGGQTYGPYTWEQIVEHARGGRIGRGDKLLDPRTGVWVKPSKVPGLFGRGGAATAPAGLSAAAMFAAGIIVILAVVLVSVLFLQPPEIVVVDGTVPAFPTTPSANPGTAVMGPEGFAFKGTYRWEEKNDPTNNWEEGPCYLWIYTNESGTWVSFHFQVDVGYLRWEDRDLPLTTETGSHYVFESDPVLTSVDQWKMVVDITDTGMSGTVTNITPQIGSFVGGSFTGVAISYEQYQAEAPS